MMKRFFDLSVSIPALIIFFPIILLAGILIKLTSKGPIFYKSKRIGKNYKPFYLLKLRTMYIDQPANAPKVTSSNDLRITPIGRFLRNTKADELPQFLNVIIGHISLVGPRPEVKKYIDKYPELYNKILTIRPGITDSATLQFIDEEKILSHSNDPEQTYINNIQPRKIKYYLDYVDNQSTISDCKILFKTVLKIIKRIR